MYFSQAYHLGGMGCSNGVVGINMIRDLLQVDRGEERKKEGGNGARANIEFHVAAGRWYLV